MCFFFWYLCVSVSYFFSFLSSFYLLHAHTNKCYHHHQNGLPNKRTATPRVSLPPNGKSGRDQHRNGRPMRGNLDQAVSNYLLPHGTDGNASRFSNNHPPYHIRMPFAPYQHIPRMRAETYAKALNTPPRPRVPNHRNFSRHRYISPRTLNSRFSNPRPVNAQSQNARFVNSVNSNFTSGNMNNNVGNPFFHDNPFSVLNSDCWF